jgi:diaminopimelate decarboxylase
VRLRAQWVDAEMSDARPPTPAERLARILTRTDHLSVDGEGRLLIEGCAAGALLEDYGSPLYVISEATLRANYRRFAAAFSSNWPEEVTILYAIKANNNLAIRAILNQEGAGGDCFGEGEFLATFAGGADPSKVVLNGSNKSRELIRKAVAKGLTINIDAEDELAAIEDSATELGVTARVNLRLKAVSEAYNEIVTDYFGGDRLADYVRRVKWGFSVETARTLVPRILACSQMDLTGYHFHIGRTSADPGYSHIWADSLSRAISELHRRTGFAPKMLNIGGGWPRERDPESRSLELNKTPLEEYAAVACSTLRLGLAAADLPTPRLWLEPGRYIVGNAVVLLARVGAVKRDLGYTWVNLDASTKQPDAHRYEPQCLSYLSGLEDEPHGRGACDRRRGNLHRLRALRGLLDAASRARGAHRRAGRRDVCRDRLYSAQWHPSPGHYPRQRPLERSGQGAGDGR